MEVKNCPLSEILKQLGVGRRPFNDDFFVDSKILAPLQLRLGVYDIDDESLCHPSVSISCHIPGCVTRFGSIMEFDSHYNAAHRYLCCECRKHLPSAHLLDLHCAESHDSFFAVLAERGPSFACYVEECKTKFNNPEERRAHCIAHHKFPVDFRYDNIKKKKKNAKPKHHKNQHKKQTNTSEEMLIDAPLNQVIDGSPKREVKQPVLKNFSFGHSKTKGFSSKGSVYTGKRFTNDCNMKDEEKDGSGDARPSRLESEDMLVELKDCLPDC